MQGGSETDQCTYTHPTLPYAAAGKFTLGSAGGVDGKKEDDGEEEEEVDARAELQSFLELQCVKRASR